MVFHSINLLRVVIDNCFTNQPSASPSLATAATGAQQLNFGKHLKLYKCGNIFPDFVSFCFICFHFVLPITMSANLFIHFLFTFSNNSTPPKSDHISLRYFQFFSVTFFEIKTVCIPPSSQSEFSSFLLLPPLTNIFLEKKKKHFFPSLSYFCSGQ